MSYSRNLINNYFNNKTIKSADVKRRIKRSAFEEEVKSFNALIHYKACSICNK